MIAEIELDRTGGWDLGILDEIKFIKNDEIVFERNAIEQLEFFLTIENTISQIMAADPDFFDTNLPEISQAAITPDFHKGTTIPIGTVLLTKGFVIPQAMGSDINCGMRLHNRWRQSLCRSSTCFTAVG